MRKKAIDPTTLAQFGRNRRAAGMGIELELAPDIALIAILIYGTLLTLLVWAGVILVFTYASLQSRKEGTNGSGNINSIQPKLAWINLFVPERAVASFGLLA